MKPRMVIIGIDDVCRLFKDYVGQVGFPQDAMPVTFMYNPTNRKVGIRVESESLNGDEGMEEIKFDLRRVYGVS